MPHQSRIVTPGPDDNAVRAATGEMPVGAGTVREQAISEKWATA
jgi:hypothetical protein